jgi:ATP/maltotriose-dependent transcriptional regulator MalT
MSDALEAGLHALQDGDWIAAREAFTLALREEETPEALSGLGDALWWLGDTHGSVEHRERAYALFRKRSDVAGAATIALTLCVHHRANVGDAAVSSGWLARAARLIENNSLDDMRGWVPLLQADESDPVRGEKLAREAKDWAAQTGDLDLELCALAQLGSALVAQGRLNDGLPLLDEAMAGALGGEGADFDTVVFTSCNMIGSCARCAEFERAIEWIRAADRFTSRYGCPFLYLYCRTMYASVLFAAGDWVQAEQELQTTLRQAAGQQAPLHGYALCLLAELRLAQGHLEEAKQLIDGVGGEGPAAPVVATIHLLRGRPEPALASAERALAAVSDEEQLDRAVLQDIAGMAEIALGKMDEAAARARDLISVGTTRGCETIRARGERLLGHATTDPNYLNAAVSAFARLGMPLETGRARMLLAEVLRGSERETCEAEARSALEEFESLGAGRDADAAAAFLRELGVKASRVGPKNLDTLTKREREVLALLAEGASNPEIAKRLYVSRKTVEHHVAHVLSKLGLRNRAEAAAAATRMGATSP